LFFTDSPSEVADCEHYSLKFPWQLVEAPLLPLPLPAIDSPTSHVGLSLPPALHLAPVILRATRFPALFAQATADSLGGEKIGTVAALLHAAT